MFFSIQIVNPHLLKDLTERGLWNEEMKNQIIACNGSIQVQNGGESELSWALEPSHLFQAVERKMSTSLVIGWLVVI